MHAVCRRNVGAGKPTRREHVERKLDELRRAMEERGLKINRNNTNTWVQRIPRRRDPFTGRYLKKAKTFTTLVEDGELDADVNHRVQSGWNNW